MSDPILFATRYILSPLPLEHFDHDLFALTIEWRGRTVAGDRAEWAVMHRSYRLGRDGGWDLEPIPSSRDTGWLAAHRFTLDEAVCRAEALLPTITVNGMYVEDGKFRKRSFNPA